MSFPVVTLLLLLQQVIDLFRTHTLVLWVVERGGQNLGRYVRRVKLHDHPIHHIVGSDVGEARILLEQLVPDGELLELLVKRLMRHHEIALLVGKRLEKLPAIDAAPTVSRSRGAVVGNRTVPAHQHRRD